MKCFLITYTRKNGSEADWHREVRRFIDALDADPVVGGRIAYRCMKARDGAGYYHLAVPADDQAAADLAKRDFFVRYTAALDAICGDAAEVVPLDVVAESRHRA